MTALQITYKIVQEIKEKGIEGANTCCFCLMIPISISLAKLADSTELVAEYLKKIERKLR